MSNLTLANRLQALQSNVFADMDRAKAASREAGNTIIDLSLGSSDLGAAPHVVDAIERSLHDPHTHGYLLHNGTRDFRITAANWYSDRFGVPIDLETEVLPLIGSQEGTAHLPLALLNP
ncbi:MAG: succinyldiaminopimelate aminotransferase, partial [Microcystis aeruginosa]